MKRPRPQRPDAPIHGQGEAWQSPDGHRVACLGARCPYISPARPTEAEARADLAKHIIEIGKIHQKRKGEC